MYTPLVCSKSCHELIKIFQLSGTCSVMFRVQCKEIFVFNRTLWYANYRSSHCTNNWTHVYPLQTWTSNVKKYQHIFLHPNTFYCTRVNMHQRHLTTHKWTNGKNFLFRPRVSVTSTGHAQRLVCKTAIFLLCLSIKLNVIANEIETRWSVTVALQSPHRS